MIYVSSACIAKEKINEIIGTYVQNGIKDIELSGGTKYYPDIEYDLVEGKKKYGLQYACHAYFPPAQEDFVVNLASCNDKIYDQSREHYRRCIKLLTRLECKTLSVHAGFLVEINSEQIGKSLNSAIIYDKQEAYDRFCNAYQELVAEAQKEQITVYLENNVINARNYQNFGYKNYFMMTDWKSICEMREKINFNLLLDLGHLYVSSHTLMLDYKQQVKMLCDQVEWIHISDNDGITDQHYPLKEGSDIVWALSYLKHKHPETNLTLETTGDISGILSSYNIVKNMGEV
ncbi:MAG: sugar phosphate isomerase/epimerase [bacterium]|nr:sugar phosphate isomerase/epimerase [bacterium]MCM1374862.1 sugar phosphate isomerase/epimerase [Muribaculum sp.]